MPAVSGNPGSRQPVTHSASVWAAPLPAMRKGPRPPLRFVSHRAAQYHELRCRRGGRLNHVVRRVERRRCCDYDGFGQLQAPGRRTDGMVRHVPLSQRPGQRLCPQTSVPGRQVQERRRFEKKRGQDAALPRIGHQLAPGVGICFRCRRKKRTLRQCARCGGHAPQRAQSSIGQGAEVLPSSARRYSASRKALPTPWSMKSHGSRSSGVRSRNT